MTQDVCATNDAAFVDYGIESGSDLIHQMYYELRGTECQRVEVTPDLMDAVTRTFRSQFVGTADLPVVPEPVEAAIADARAETVHELLGPERVSLRRDLLPTFVQSVARLSCGYRSYYENGGAGIEYGK